MLHYSLPRVCHNKSSSARRRIVGGWLGLWALGMNQDIEEGGLSVMHALLLFWMWESKLDAKGLFVIYQADSQSQKI